MVERWPDASGNKRDLLQSDEASRPRYFAEGTFHALRFDGKTTHFKRLPEKQSVAGMTGFIVLVPHANRGAFSGFLAAAATGQNDYRSGFNIDFGIGRTPGVQAINIEGTGTNGWMNFLNDATVAKFGSVLRVGFTDSADGITLSLNDRPQRRRERGKEGLIHLDELVVGARYYSNAGPSEVCGFFEGDLAEILLYDRVLSAEEQADIGNYLKAKYKGIASIPLPESAIDVNALVPVESPPPVQMFVPGFEVRELPVELTNINNVLYRPDGKLVALGYNGTIWLLSDSDGDGVEDRVETFFQNNKTIPNTEIMSPIGMALMPQRPGEGMRVVIASKGKCSILQDSDNDNRADKEIVIATGWQEIPHRVDALGVDVDLRDGSVFFGLGCQDYGDIFGLGKDKTPYSIHSERGTIMRIAPDFQSREIVATGIRFPVAVRFNQAGDVFCTDQEGATWLPNGNPFDELLHIETGRHYGFPPRHPRHLPDVIDEPSVFDYKPQHQSTCGLNFNEPVNGGPVFGPDWWQSDAIVTGYSRGKLYRTKLVKTPSGYVAQNQLIANCNMLPADACVSPSGDLLIAAHGGGPDWGSGAAGRGKLFKVTPIAAVSRPVFAWAQNPREVRVAFDAPLSADQLTDLKTGASIEYGAAVAAGDRF
ncbi:MAG TPA: hypothetical protein VNQ76_18435, partial [Planctomicrobium sp.]|nr:hypothetical protein [Planctomicrobium sp.]